MATATVFISYSREDSDFMMKIKSHLEQLNIKVWVDKNIKPGNDWDSAIESALNASDSIILILSPNSKESRMVLNEVSFSIDNGKKVIPVMIAECTLPLTLQRTQFIDFCHQDFETASSQLVKALHLEPAGTATPSQPSADPIVAPTKMGGPTIVEEPLTKNSIEGEAASKTPANTHGDLLTAEKPRREEAVPPKKSKSSLYVVIVLAIVAIIVVVYNIIPSTDDTIDDVKEIDDAWVEAQSENTIEGYLDYLTYSATTPEEETQALNSLLPFFPNEGYIQYEESDGTMLLDVAYAEEPGSLSVGDMLRVDKSYRIRKGPYGAANYNSIVGLTQPDAYVLVLEEMDSNGWLLIGFYE